MNEHQPTPDTLTEQQREFCRQYIIDFNAARAYREAGYAKSTSYSHVYDCLKLPEVQAEIARLIAERARRTLMSADRVVIELAALAFSSHQNYRVDDAGEVVLADGTDPIAHQAVASVKRKVRRLGRGEDKIEETEVEVKLWDKPQALKMLMLHLGMIEKKMLLAGDPSKPLKVEGKHEHEHRAALPADATIAACLRRLGLPVPGGVPADGGG